MIIDSIVVLTIVKILVVFIGTYFSIKIIIKAVSKMKISAKVVKLCNHCVLLFGWAVGVVTILGTLNVNVSALIAGLGLTGFAVGFACKDVLANVLSGLILMIYSPFEINDFITVKGKSGKFIDINFRYVTLIDGAEIVLIPNSVILNEVILINDSLK